MKRHILQGATDIQQALLRAIIRVSLVIHECSNLEVYMLQESNPCKILLRTQRQPGKAIESRANGGIKNRDRTTKSLAYEDAEFGPIEHHKSLRYSGSEHSTKKEKFPIRSPGPTASLLRQQGMRDEATGGLAQSFLSST